MAQFLKQSTAFTFRIGPFVDSTDGVTAETALTIGQADIQISKAGGAFAQTSASPTTTHDADGWYQCPLTTTDTGTLGTLTVQIVMAGALPVWKDFMVLPANVYDSLVAGSDVLDVSVTQFGGTAGTFASGRPEVNTTNIAGTTLPANGPIPFFGIVDMGTAQSYDGATDKLRLRAAFSSPDVVGCWVWVYSSTNGLHTRGIVTAWDNTNKDATIDTPVQDPTGTLLYVLVASPKSSTALPLASDVYKWNGTTIATPDTAGYPKVTIKDGTGAGEIALTAGVVDTVGAVTGAVGSVTGAVGSVTGNVGGNVTGSVGSVATGGITAASIATGAFDADALATDAVTEIVTGVLTSAMTEAYPTDGSTMTVAQALYLIAQSIGEFSVSGTTVTVKKVDGTTTAATYTLDSSTAPTSRTRAT